LSEEFYEDGKVKTKANYRNGKLDGERVSYYPSGVTKKREHFKNDKRDGECKLFYTSGNKQVHGNYRNDKRHGITKKYYNDGRLYQELIFKHGYIINAFEYSDSGARKKLVGSHEDEIVTN
jgi:antitoxin component YwqK of YwqJK toxin-antitoxin module